MNKRKIVLNLCSSLDSYIEGPNGEIDWCMLDQDYGLTNFFNRIDSIFFGRKSYQQLLDQMPDAFPDKQKIVFSTTLKKEKNNTRIIRSDIEKEVKNLLKEPGKDIWLFGGAELTSTLLNLNLVHEMIISVHPLILGEGKPLFIDIKERKKLTLKDTKIYSTGLAQLYYDLKID
ncbi:MAG: dihydrofolate reductase family protein [Candidatus Cyclobacteriaceae bacterium M2_1C_046]